MNKYFGTDGFRGLGDGHDYVLHFETIVKPTCEKDGKLTVTCNDCAYKADVIIYKLNT